MVIRFCCYISPQSSATNENLRLTNSIAEEAQKLIADQCIWKNMSPYLESNQHVIPVKNLALLACVH